MSCVTLSYCVMIPRFLEDWTLELLGNSKVAAKFQVTIPKAVREIRELETGDLLVFVREHDDAVSIKRGKVSIEK